jgi:hypothetical protein
MDDELDVRVRALLAESLRPIPPRNRWSTPEKRRQALAEAIGYRDTYTPED